MVSDDFDVVEFPLIFNRMDVAAYIKELLNRGHFVYVPGLGTFLKRKSAGIYNPEQQLFYPPKNSIDFVAEEKQDDTLENYISRQKNISQQAARYFIDKFVEQLKNNPDTRNLPVKEALFPEGDVTSEDQKTIAAFNQENFGLPPVSLTAIKKTADFAEKEVVSKQDYIENAYPEVSNDILEEEIKPEKRNIFWAAAFLLLAIGILGCYALYLYRPDLYNRFLQQKQSVAIITQKPIIDTDKHVLVTETQNIKDTAKTKISTDTIAAALAQTVSPVAKDTATVAADPDLVEKSPYEIIGAAFKTLKGAKIFLGQLKAKGMHHAKILKNTHEKATLITFGSFKDKETAKAGLARLRAKDVRSEAYIQHYKIK